MLKTISSLAYQDKVGVSKAKTCAYFVIFLYYKL